MTLNFRYINKFIVLLPGLISFAVVAMLPIVFFTLLALYLMRYI